MKDNIMDRWLCENANARYNLGESGVVNLRIDEVVEPGGCAQEFLHLDFDHNDVRGSSALRAEISGVYDGIDIDDVLVTAGVSEAILLYFLAKGQAGANIVLPLPAFHLLYDVPQLLGYEIRSVFLQYEDGFRLPIDEIERAVDAQTCAIVLNSPHNPTGVLYSELELSEVIRIADRYGCDVVMDEHYRFLPFNSPRNYVPSLYPRYPNVVSFGSPGKCFGCVGLRIGWIVGRRETIEECRRFKGFTTFTISKASDFLAWKVLQKRETLTTKFKGWICENLRCLSALQSELHSRIEWVEPQAGIVAFPRLVDREETLTFATQLLAETEVLVLPGECMEAPGHFRVRLGVEPREFAAAMDRLAVFLGRGR